VPSSNGDVSAILLDAGGVLVFPEPKRVLPPLHAAGVNPDLATLERAHYLAMAQQDADALSPVQDTWWRDYLRTYIAACGVPPDRREEVVTTLSHGIKGVSWAHVGTGAMDGLRAVAALGLPVAVVSNSDGSVEGDLRRLGVCHVPPARDAQEAAGVPVGIVLDSAVVGVAKPDPAIFYLALDALGIPPSATVLHVGDSLRYDVAGALAAGLRPVHMDPFGFCPQPEGHLHVRRLADLTTLISAPH